jgi:hypothetical protein
MIFAMILMTLIKRTAREGRQIELIRSAGERGDMPASLRDRVSHEQFCCISYNSVILSTIPSLLGL